MTNLFLRTIENFGKSCEWIKKVRNILSRGLKAFPWYSAIGAKLLNFIKYFNFTLVPFSQTFDKNRIGIMVQWK